MEPVTVSTWAELTDKLYEGAWNEQIGRFRSNWAFRGMQDAAFDLSTTLARLGGAFQDNEQDLLRNFKKYAFHQAAMGDSTWNWLALAQHHGLPTRLLDWTYSPFVAMHFATADIELYDRDAAVLCVDYVKTNNYLPGKLKGLLEREDSNVFTAEMLDEAGHNLADFDNLSKHPFVVFLEPPSLDERIVNQYALFSLMSSPKASLHEWLADKPELCHSIIIPASLKWEIRDKLDQANITERVLFPGLDGLGKWLKRYYSPRSAGPPGADAAGG